MKERLTTKLQLKKEIQVSIADRSRDVYVVRSFSNRLLKARCYIKSYDERLNVIELEIDPMSRSILSEVLSGSKTVTVFLADSKCMFISYLIKSKPNVLIVSEPKDYNFYDRREHERYIVSKTPLRFTFHPGRPYTPMRKDCFDISLGGCSLTLSSVERFRGKVGDLLSKVSFEYKDKIDFIDCTVTSFLKLEPFQIEHIPYASSRVSFCFNYRDLNQQAYINWVVKNVERENASLVQAKQVKKTS